jgi:hypothetical protein
MSAIRSALDEWGWEDDYTLTIDQLGDDIVELEIVSEIVEMIRLRKLNAFDRRGGLARTGHASLTSFLIDRCRMAAGRAKRLVSLANAARTASKTFDAWQDGRISTGQAQRLLDISQAVRDAYPHAEETVIDAIQGLSASDTNNAFEYRRQAVDGADRPSSIAFAGAVQPMCPSCSDSQGGKLSRHSPLMKQVFRFD